MNSEYLATSICKILRDKGYTAYFAGGWVRDFLIGIPSDDIDIATSATPETVIQLFDRTIEVGKQFGVTIIILDNHSFEVTTFRKDVTYSDGRKPDSIHYTTAEEDAMRRDFTINGLFYNPIEKEIFDFINGEKDIKQKVIRAIGNPYERFEEDRLRMIRAVRFSARFNFEIEEKTKEAIKATASKLLPAVSMERIWQEFNKIITYPNSDKAFIALQHLKLLPEIFDSLKKISDKEIKKRVSAFQFFPSKCPAILYILEILHKIEDKEVEPLCLYLKTNNDDRKLAVYSHTLRRHCQTAKKTSLTTWAHLYAHPSNLLCLNFIKARLDPSKQKKFLESHYKRQERLKFPIERIKNQTPLVSSSDLTANGIKPGKEIGLLLKEAENLSIEKNLNSSDEVLKLLKQSKMWPKS